MGRVHLSASNLKTNVANLPAEGQPSNRVSDILKPICQCNACDRQGFAKHSGNPSSLLLDGIKSESREELITQPWSWSVDGRSLGQDDNCRQEQRASSFIHSIRCGASTW